jgi:predicted nuclease with RNAse H fold
VLPTASWTIWGGKREGRRRARWTRETLEQLQRDGLTGLPNRRLNQDGRDAIAAALTAQLYADGNFIGYEEIIVPSKAPDLG